MQQRLSDRLVERLRHNKPDGLCDIYGYPDPDGNPQPDADAYSRAHAYPCSVGLCRNRFTGYRSLEWPSHDAP
jgi:hypothetical protein